MPEERDVDGTARAIVRSANFYIVDYWASQNQSNILTKLMCEYAVNSEFLRLHNFQIWTTFRKKLNPGIRDKQYA